MAAAVPAAAGGETGEGGSARRYERGTTVALTDWNWKYPVELQDVAWDCAAASLTWCLNAAGYPTTEADVVAGLGPSRISAAYGLLDASGAGLVEYLAELGVQADYDDSATWEEMIGSAGHQPMLMGGRNWCHWTGVRISSTLFPEYNLDQLALANPAPGYMGVSQTIDREQFDALGVFSAVWFTDW
jgi:hypothetical protein